jgi:hypothetical protein
MKTGRYSAPIALLNDMFIFVAGGSIAAGKNKFTNSCEIYDISSNRWSIVENMQKARGNTSLCPVDNKLVFVFHGLPSTMQPTQSNVIEFIDFGSFDNPIVRDAHWESLVVQNGDFILNEPRGSSQISETDIIVFGGMSKDTFLFDFSNIVSSKPKQGTMAWI